MPDGRSSVVYLRSTANLSTGGTATDVTDIIHPDNRDMAVRAIRAIGLDVGGVDFLTTDIAESYRTIGGGICEVNAAPGFRMHVAPSEGTPRDVAGSGHRHAVPAGRAVARADRGDHRHERQDHDRAHARAHHARWPGYTPGLTTTDGVYIDGQRTVQGDMTGPVSAQMVLADPQIDIAVLETARGGLLRAGMGVQEVNVGAVLNVQADHLGLQGHRHARAARRGQARRDRSRDGLRRAERRRPARAQDVGPHRGEEHLLRDDEPAARLVREHIRAGGRACALEAGVNGQMITLYDRGSHIPLVWTHLIPATLEGRATHNVQNAMFAAAMAFSLGIKLDAIRQGLRTFDTTFFQAPGRMNVFNEHPFKVLFDYGHNAHAVGRWPTWRSGSMSRAGASWCSPGPATGATRTCTRSQRRWPAASTTTSAGATTICASARWRRSAANHGECAVGRGRCRGRRSRSFRTNRKRSRRRSSMGQPGDLLLVFADALTRSWKQITKFRPAGAPAVPVRAASCAAALARRNASRAGALRESRRPVARRTRHPRRARG